MEKGSVGVFHVVKDNHKCKVLLVRHGNGEKKWGLPGGGMHQGENPKEAAIRETKEETGLFIPDVSFVGGFGLKKSFGVVWLFESVLDEKNYRVANRWMSPDGREIEECGFFYIAEIKELEERSLIYSAQFGFIQWAFLPSEARPYFGNPSNSFLNLMPIELCF